jgi:uroporphyrinogen-III decarboxylase
MDSRTLVKHAIARRATPRVPYRITLTPEAWSRVAGRAGGASADEWLGNDVVGIAPPWWWWDGERAGAWKGEMPPAGPEPVCGVGDYKAFTEACQRARDQGRYVLVTIYASHWEKAYFLRGIENFLADMAGDPDWSRGFLARIIERNLVMLDNILGLPSIDGVLLGSDWGTQRGMLMSPKVWRELIAPGEQRSYDRIHAAGKDVWVHSCGDIRPILPDLVTMGVDVLNPIQPECMDIAMLKQTYGSRISFWGGVSTQRTLPHGTPAEVRAESLAVKELMGAGGGFIFAPAQELQDDVPFENLEALLEVARA